MRYSREHKDQARRRLLDSSARHVKQHGFAASGVDAIASAAGVTSGSLYKHFAGKTDLFAAVIRADLRRTADRLAKIQAGDAEAADKAMAAYLSCNTYGVPSGAARCRRWPPRLLAPVTPCVPPSTMACAKCTRSWNPSQVRATRRGR